MELINFILHIDDHLRSMIATHGTWVYGIVFGIIFAETGLVIAPFLPGDSLLFALGMLANPGAEGGGHLNVWILFFSLWAAAFIGDNLNYQVGRTMGRRMFANPNSKIFRQSYLRQTEGYFEKHGSWTLVVARFVPIVRTFAPFVAGMGEMPFPTFLKFSFLGGLIWVGVCLFAGYFFGMIPFVQHNFEKIIIVVIVFSIIPMVMKIRKARKVAKETA